MRKPFFILAASTLLVGTAAQADTFAVYSRTVSGARVSSFSTSILRILPEYSSKKFASTTYVVKNITTNKEAYVEAFVLEGKKLAYVQQATPGIVSSTVFISSPATFSLDAVSGASAAKNQVLLYRSTAASQRQFLDDGRRPYLEKERLSKLVREANTPGNNGTADLTIHDQSAISGAIRAVSLPKSNNALLLAPSLVGNGLSVQVHALRDTDGNVLDYQSSEVISFGFTEKWALNISLSETVNTGFPVSQGGQSLNPGDSGYAVFQVLNMLRKQGYQDAPLPQG